MKSSAWNGKLRGSFFICTFLCNIHKKNRKNHHIHQNSQQYLYWASKSTINIIKVWSDYSPLHPNDITNDEHWLSRWDLTTLGHYQWHIYNSGEPVGSHWLNLKVFELKQLIWIDLDPTWHYNVTLGFWKSDMWKYKIF